MSDKNVSVFEMSGVSVLAGNAAQLSQALGMKDDNKLYVNAQYWISPETRNKIKIKLPGKLLSFTLIQLFFKVMINGMVQSKIIAILRLSCLLSIEILLF